MKKEITSQYKAALKMLMDAIKKCPDDLWANEEYENQYWRIVYHTLYYTLLYLEPSEFSPWEKHKPDYNRLGWINENNEPIIINNTYTKKEMLEYAQLIFSRSENLVQNTPMDDESGFDWLPLKRGELHLYNIRHIQHHTGQLIERLRENGVKGIEWEDNG